MKKSTACLLGILFLVFIIFAETTTILTNGRNMGVLDEVLVQLSATIAAFLFAMFFLHKQDERLGRR